MLLKSKQTLTTRRQKDRTVRDRQPKLLRATWAVTDPRGPRGKTRPRTDRHAAKRGPPGTAGQTGKPHCPYPMRVVPTPASQDPESPQFVHRGIRRLPRRASAAMFEM